MILGLERWGRLSSTRLTRRHPFWTTPRVSTVCTGIKIGIYTHFPNPLDFIKDSARPSYWVSDAESPNCAICSLVFGTDEEALAVATAGDRNGNSQFPITEPVDTRRHHCRSCGLSVCNSCSRGRRPVPERNWMSDVRVCDACINLGGS